VENFKEKVMCGYYTNHNQGSELLDIDLEKLFEYSNDLIDDLELEIENLNNELEYLEET